MKKISKKAVSLVLSGIFMCGSLLAVKAQEHFMQTKQDFYANSLLEAGEEQAIAYNTVADMAADMGLAEGQIVSTLGYYSAGDGGASVYSIVSATEPDVQGEVIPLDNGKKAKLSIIDQTIDVKQFGAVGDGITDESDLLQYVFNYLLTDRVEKITLAAGTYVVNKQMVLNSGIYEGKEGAKIKITLLNHNWCFRNKKALWTTEGDNGGVDTIIIDGIDFSYYNNVPEQVGVNMKMIRFDNTIDSKIINCNFYTEEGNFNGVCALDMYTNNKNLTIDRCNFNLFSTNMNTEAGKRPAVTAMAIREYRSYNTTENVNITNCYMEKNGWDEIVWLDAWVGTLKDVVIDNCQMIDKGIGVTSFFIGANYASALAENITVKNSTLEKHNYSYVLAHVGSKGEYETGDGSRTGITKDITFDNNIVNIKSVSNVGTGSCLFLNAYTLPSPDKTSNILYNNTTINADETINFIFRDGNDTTTCKNTHLNIKGGYIAFFGVKEVDGLTSDTVVNSHIAKNVPVIKNATVQLGASNNFVHDDGYQRPAMNMSNCNVSCANFVGGSIRDKNTNYYQINISDCDIKSSSNFLSFWFDPGQAATANQINASVVNSKLTRKSIYSRYPNKVNCVFTNSTLNGKPIS